jgi:hypothetical protein
VGCLALRVGAASHVGGLQAGGQGALDLAQDAATTWGEGGGGTAGRGRGCEWQVAGEVGHCSVKVVGRSRWNGQGASVQA